MAIPISYNLRNLAVRKTTTIMTALGIALTVAVLLSVLALLSGLNRAFATAGHPLHLLLLRKGSTAELSSGLIRRQFQDVKFKQGIALEGSEPLASLEIVTVIVLESPDLPGGMNVTIRGLLPVGVRMREQVKIASGRWFESGKREICVGKGIANRYPDAQLGKQLKFGKGAWTVVGVFDAGTSAINGEILGDLNQIAADFDRSDGLSSILVRAQDATAVPALINSIKDDVRLNLDAQKESDYYAAQTASGAPIQFFGLFISIIMAVGSSFAAMNTMYAAVARRAKEVGTLRVLGFSKGAILLSFLFESLLLSLLGGILGCLLVLPFNNLTTGIGNFVTFAETSFSLDVSPQVMLSGIAFALVLGGLGGLFPAGSAARKEILAALREG